MELNTLEDISNLCVRRFNALPKTGKPKDSEWTVLSGIVECRSGRRSVVSLGTGTKCVGQDQLCSKGSTINDSHAEVMVRRGFLRYLYSEIMKGEDSNTVVYNAQKNGFELKDGVSFHFFSSHLPCGDASILIEQINNDAPSTKRPKISIESCENDSIGDVVYTGARLINTQKSDLMSQDIGAIRTKPGRGVRTLSVSCSDKIARWNVVGIQGALLSLIIPDPIYISSFAFRGPNFKEAVERAIWKRWKLEDFTHTKYKFQKPTVTIIKPESIDFNYSKVEQKSPSATSIVWCNVPERSLEVAVNGKRQGLTRKQQNSSTGSLCISKYNLLKNFVTCIQCCEDKGLKLSASLTAFDVRKLPYREIKIVSKEYQDAWTFVKQNIFRNWTQKPENLYNDLA